MFKTAFNWKDVLHIPNLFLFVEASAAGSLFKIVTHINIEFQPNGSLDFFSMRKTPFSANTSRQPLATASDEALAHTVVMQSPHSVENLSGRVAKLA